MTEPFVETKVSPKTVEEQIKAKTLLEKLAELEHEQWGHWVRFMQDYTSTRRKSPRWEVWRKQALTPYSQLSEEIKESDRNFARKVLAVVNADRAEHNKKFTEAFDKIDSALDWVVPVQHLTIIKELIQKQLAELKL